MARQKIHIKKSNNVLKIKIVAPKKMAVRVVFGVAAVLTFAFLLSGILALFVAQMWRIIPALIFFIFIVLFLVDRFMWPTFGYEWVIVDSQKQEFRFSRKGLVQFDKLIISFDQILYLNTRSIVDSQYQKDSELDRGFGTADGDISLIYRQKNESWLSKQFDQNVQRLDFGSALNTEEIQAVLGVLSKYLTSAS